MEQSDKTKEIIRLRADGKRYEDIVDILGCTKKSVAYVCQKYKCTYHDIEDKWIESLSKLRHDGYDYIEISKMLNVDRERIENYCRRLKLSYSDLGDSSKYVKLGGIKMKAIPVVDWSQRIQDRLGNGFELVGQDFKSGGESVLYIKCLICGNTNKLSSQSLRKNRKYNCPSCLAIKKINDEIIMNRERSKQKRERSRKPKQLGFEFCECGQIVSYGMRTCDNCKEEHRRNSQRKSCRKKELARRLRERQKYESGITLEKVYERDNGVCYICNKECNWSDFQKVNSSFITGWSYPTIEHVKPLCKGGTHTWDNVRLACFRCNTMKGTKEIN